MSMRWIGIIASTAVLVLAIAYIAMKKASSSFASKKQKKNGASANIEAINVVGKLVAVGPVDSLRLIVKKHLAKKYDVMTDMQYIGMMAGCVMFSAIGGYMYMKQAWFVPISALLGAFAPEIYLNQQVKKRQKTLNKQVVSLTQLVIQAIRAGVGVPEAFEKASEKLGDPIIQEVAPLIQYTKAGFSIADACREAKKLTSSRYLAKVYNTIIMTYEAKIGDAIVERLMTIRKSIMSEIAAKEAMMADAAGAVMTRSIIIAIVPLVALNMAKRNPGVVAEYFKSIEGMLLLVFGIGMYVGGIVYTGKVIDRLR